MSRNDLRELFTVLAEDVPQARLAEAAVAGARRVRRRRRFVAGAALAVAATTVTAVAVWSPKTVPPSGTVGSPSASARPSPGIRIDILPDNIIYDDRTEPFWAATLTPQADAPSLAAAPLSHAVLLRWDEPADHVFAYGEGSINGGSGDGRFRWVRLDVKLTKVRDVAGVVGFPLDPNSLGPLGERAAFAQTDEVVVVDMRTGKVNRIPVPGPNSDVTWLPNGKHLLVSGLTQTWLVNVDTRTRVRAAVPGHDVTPLVGGASDLTALSPSPVDGPPTLTRYDDGGLSETGGRTVDDSPAGQYSIGRLYPRGWRYGNLIAQAARGWPGTGTGEVIVVIDDRDATVVHLLDLRREAGIGCCAVAGWAGPDAVLVHANPDGLLRWHLPTGTVTRLSPGGAGRLSVAPTGCDWTITIDHVTSACTR